MALRNTRDFTLMTEDAEDQLISLCELQCTKAEVAAFFKVGISTLERRIKEKYGDTATWKEVFAQYAGTGRISLRRCQFKLAQKSAAMAIFLGKNYLNQVDVKTVDDINKPITITWTDAKQTKEVVEVKLNETTPDEVGQ